MCGFVSYVSLTGEPPERELIARMTQLVAHRGPDDVGFFFDRRVAFGFRRLSILDLAATGHQPMESHDGRHVIVFNGAIYNYLELRTELERLGHPFKSSGDTEVLLTAYRQWGDDCLQRLNGMWSFAVYDKVTKRVFAARDRFGIKPLYIYRSERAIVLASELKSIRDAKFTQLRIDWSTATDFLVEGRLDHTTGTFYQGVESLAAGHAFSIEADGSWKQWRYWDLDEAVQATALPLDPVQTFAELFEDAVGIRLRSDVTVGVLLSGGLDSTSIICSMARQLRGESGLAGYSFSTEEFDETSLIAATVQQTGARVSFLGLNARDFWDSIGEHLWFQDEPVHSFVSVVGYQLMRVARAGGATVLLNGQGADEVLAGYPNYYRDYASDLVRDGQWGKAFRTLRSYTAAQGNAASPLSRSVLRDVLGRILNIMPGYGALGTRNRRRLARANTWLNPDVFSLWNESASAESSSLNDRLRYSVSSSLNDRLRYSVEHESLPLYLRIEDRNSMAHATEVRLPFLDYRLVALAFRLGAEWKLNDGVGKHILRSSMRDRIPEVVRARRVKYGFPIPVERWFRDDLYEPMRDLLASREFRESGVWNATLVERELERHRRGEISAGARLFDVAQFSMWLGLQADWRERRVCSRLPK